ncbi:MAG: snoRNA-binding protein [Chrysothrix sp. TS-e1954]|nr:MAG: snoRNA-binding protein [Chrysothrix sp. TS-e1954]
MAKDRPEGKKDKKEHKDKKHKHSTENGVKKHKKEKHEKKSRLTSAGEPEVTTTTTIKSTKEAPTGDDSDSGEEAAERTVVQEAVPSNTEPEVKTVKRKRERMSNGDTTVGVYQEASFVPFAHPLADEKALKKVLKGVKRASKRKTAKRGVKEVQKFLRKSGATLPSQKGPPHAIVVLAADISPMDVISHLPVFCEDHGVPYIFVPSRAELGAAGGTKRPTSVVMLVKDLPKKQAEGQKEEEGESWEESYAEVVKVVTKAQGTLKV